MVLLGVVIGEKALAGARVSQHVRSLIDLAPRDPEGRGIRFAVTRKSGVAATRQLAALKLST